NKLVFFADYQGQRMVSAGATAAQLFTSRARNGDFGQLCTDFGGAFSSTGACTGGTGTTQLVYPTGSTLGTPGSPIPNNNLAAAGFTINPVAKNLFAQTKNYPLPQ